MKENMLQTFCFQELQAGTGSFCMEIVAYNGRPFYVFVDEFLPYFALL